MVLINNGDLYRCCTWWWCDDDDGLILVVAAVPLDSTIGHDRHAETKSPMSYKGSGRERIGALHNSNKAVVVAVPDCPPYRAHLGNISYDLNEQVVEEFFGDLKVCVGRLIG